MPTNRTHPAPTEAPTPPSALRQVVFQPRQLIAARTDEQAIEAWLSQCASRTTAANYRKDAKRFLMWLNHRGASLQTLVVEDLAAYGKFLASLDTLSPTVAMQWISTRRWPRGDIRWRPFQGPLSRASQRQALVDCLSCCPLA